MFIIAVVSSVGQTGHIGIVEVDVGGFGRLAIGVVVAVVMVMVVMMVARVGHRVCPRQTSHRLLHVGVVRRRLHLQRALRGVGLVAVGPPVTTIHKMVTEESAVPLWRNAHSKNTRAWTCYSVAEQTCH